jgi:uncharacterized protein (DUF3084 family)
MVGLIFILGLIIVSGLVAYAGDNIGRRVGKAKMMLFGLRPKYTSIMVAIITGMIITAITISALAIFSKDVRTMLFQLRQIQEDLITSKADLEASEQRLDEVSQSLDNAQSQLSDLRDKLASKDIDIILKEELINEKEQELAALTADREQLAAEITGLEKSLASVRGKVDDLGRQLNEKENLISQRTYEITQLESEAQRLNNQLSELTSNIAVLQAEYDAKIAEIQKIRWGGVKVIEGQIIADFTVNTSLSDADIIKRILRAKQTWDTEDPNNQYGNPMANPMNEQITEAIEAVRRYRDNFGDDMAVVRVIASAHVFEDEEVPVELKVERYLLVYQGDEVISRKLFSAGDDRNTIRKGVYEMLEAIEGQAQEKGMIFEGIEQAVWADVAEIVEMARRASYYPNDFYINLVAKRDIYNTEYLVLAPDYPEKDNMKFIIEEIEPEPEWGTPP